ncbi:MAG: site-specific DNA-methyltransferase [Candidatus Lokiarchaeota archaeon]|nr:site-specific DNA-methyltransferase [Candidatus Lokiarchaeota archaeon]MBD3342694.1 site-specific DNA-methyltransferase [Candidatus Lokiarchaeota archaeon]
MIKPYFQENNFIIYRGQAQEILKELPENHFELIFVDPPYFLSNGGITCSSGKMVSVNKGDWDKSKGFQADIEFIDQWLKGCRRVLKDDGSIWISGTLHIIYKVGYLLEKNKFDIINDIVWYKPNAPPNLSCRYFTHSHEIVIWARKAEGSNHTFNYKKTKHWNNSKDKLKNKNKQMRSVWSIPLIPKSEKEHGKHPTQKPIELLNRIIASSSKKGDKVLDPFMGSGTTGIVASVLKRKFVGIDSNNTYLDLAIKRFQDENKKDLLYSPQNNYQITKFTQ